MAYFWKTLALILIGIILWLVLEKQEKDTATLLSLAVCCGVMAAAAIYLQPVLDFLRRLEALGELERETLGTLLKVVGIGVASEMTAMICTDAGNSSMAGMVRFLSCTATLYVSLPIMETLMNLLQDILGVL